MPPTSGARHRIVAASRSMLSVFSLEGDALGTDKRAFQTPHQSLHAANRSARASVLLFLAAISLIMVSNMLSPSHPHPVHLGADSLHHHSVYSRLAKYPNMRVEDTPDFKEMSSEEKEAAKELERELKIAVVNRTFSPEAPRDGEPFGRLIILTMDRARSLQRLLDSAQVADYDEDRVDIDIWIDRPKNGGIDPAVAKVAENFVWSHGAKTIHSRRENGGLFQQWIYTWKVPEQTEELAVILEDDLELSTSFYQWLKIARSTYGSDPEVGAFTLQRSTLRPKLNRSLPGGTKHVLALPKEVTVFKYRLLGSWGFAPQREAWVEFRKWFEAKRAKHEKPYVEGLITTDWYKKQEVASEGYAPTMWTQWWIRFVHEKGYFTVTPHLEDGSTLCANWRESGMHYSSGRMGKDFPVFKGTKAQFSWPVTPCKVEWDGSISGNSTAG